jgi:hypothetical protein
VFELPLLALIWNVNWSFDSNLTVEVTEVSVLIIDCKDPNFPLLNQKENVAVVVLVGAEDQVLFK